jgi:hypothetical protein
MRCATARKWISRFIDGDLEAGRREQLEKHISGCDGCRKLVQDFRKIVDTAGETHSPPPSDMIWGKIQRRLEPEQRRLAVPSLPADPARSLSRWVFPATAVAAAALLLVAGALFLKSGFWNRGPLLSQLDRQHYTLNKLEEAELHYQRAIKALAEAVEAQGSEINPELAAVFESNLEIVNMSITACKRAVLQNPEDIESRRFLLAAYKQKADLLDTLMNIKDEFSPQIELGNTL